MLSTIYFSYTRSAWVQIAFSLGTIFIFEPRARKLLCVLGIVFTVVFSVGILGKFSMESGTLFSRREASMHDRINIMNAGLNMFTEKPLAGFGYGNFEKYAYTERYFTGVEGVPLRGQGEGNHNVILGLLAEVGLIGTIPYLFIFYYFAKVSQSLVKRCKRGPLFEKDMGVVNLAIVTGYFISIQFMSPVFCHAEQSGLCHFGCYLFCF